MPYYIRRKKINPNDAESRIDFIDQNGDKWQEFGVLHPKFKQWIQLKTQTEDVSVFNSSELDTLYIQSPWYKSCANDINWIKRIEIQSVIQKYTTNAISSTINLPENVSVKEVSEIYMAAWKQGLKGITIYRENCRTGVLVNKDTVTKEVAFSQKDAVKRPELLTADVHVVSVKGVKYTVIVSVLENHPYEVFVLTNTEVHCKKGVVHKASKNVYNFKDENGNICAENISKSVTNEEAAIARLISTSLRHGVAVRFLVEQLNKTEGANITSYTKAISRVLKTYISEGTTSKEKCTECGEEAMIYEEGCKKCKSCGHSRC
jgi:ribonucleoside-diphosphate reductase alpha chain